jgi:hypothetical protein
MVLYDFRAQPSNHPTRKKERSKVSDYKTNKKIFHVKNAVGWCFFRPTTAKNGVFCWTKAPD